MLCIDLFFGWGKRDENMSDKSAGCRVTSFTLAVAGSEFPNSTDSPIPGAQNATLAGGQIRDLM